MDTLGGQTRPKDRNFDFQKPIKPKTKLKHRNFAQRNILINF